MPEPEQQQGPLALIVQGTRYEWPTNLNIREMKTFRDMGADLPTDEHVPDGYQIAAFIMIMKQRAGEAITSDAIDELTDSDFEIEFKEQPNGGPPPNRAQRRAAAGKTPSGSPVTTLHSSGT